MDSTLADSAVVSELERLYALARTQYRMLYATHRWRLRPSINAQKRADTMSDVVMPVAPATGRLLYSLVRSNRPETVVEFGMSLGISTLHIAAALRDNGFGHVITTELNADKVTAASETFRRAGLSDLITVRHGDARQELAEVPSQIGIVLLDGWDDLYFDVIKLLEPQLAPGALVVADNVGRPATRSYAEHVRDPRNGYVSSNITARDIGSVEISCWTGSAS